MADDEFDKEAERERLREKYGDDGKDDTRRMSELLLKGATMTNRHCETCGDPIFRQNGQEFCPTCSAAAQQSGEATQTADDQRGQQSATNGAPQPAENGGQQPTQSAAGQQAGHPTGQQQPTHNGGHQPNGQRVDQNSGQQAGQAGGQQAGQTGSQQPGQAGGQQAGQPGSQQPGQAGGQQPGQAGSQQPGQVGGQQAGETHHGEGDRQTETAARGPTAWEGTDSLSDARAALVTAVARHTRAGTETDDPRRAKDHFAAAREAAETLAALRR